MSATEFPKFCISWGHTENCTSGKIPWSISPLGVTHYGKLEVLFLIEFSSIGLSMIEHFKHIYPWRWIGLSDSIFINVDVIIIFGALNKVGSLGGSFLALAHFVEMSNFMTVFALGILGKYLSPGWCSCFLHLMHLPSTPGGFLD